MYQPIIIASIFIQLVFTSMRFRGQTTDEVYFGRKYAKGFVEMNINGKWKPLYAVFFDNNDAKVTCKMIGYKSGGSNAGNIFHRYVPANSHKLAILGSLKCTGQESSIYSCPHASLPTSMALWGVQAVQVRCLKDDTSGMCATHRCTTRGHCYMSNGRPKCLCPAGFKSLFDSCVDINECISYPHKCSSNAYCRNTIGSYTCVCKNGFIGNGRVCIPKNCYSVRCPPGALCVMRNNQPMCRCMGGYISSGGRCLTLTPTPTPTPLPGSETVDCMQQSQHDTCSDKKKDGKTELIGIALSIVGAVVVILILFLGIRKSESCGAATSRVGTNGDRTNNGAQPTGNNMTTLTTNVFVITPPTGDLPDPSASNAHIFDPPPNYFALYPEGPTSAGLPSYDETVGEGNGYETLTTVTLPDRGNHYETTTNHYDNVEYDDFSSDPPPVYEEIASQH